MTHTLEAHVPHTLEAHVMLTRAVRGELLRASAQQGRVDVQPAEVGEGGEQLGSGEPAEGGGREEEELGGVEASSEPRADAHVRECVGDVMLPRAFVPCRRDHVKVNRRSWEVVT